MTSAASSSRGNTPMTANTSDDWIDEEDDDDMDFQESTEHEVTEDDSLAEERTEDEGDEGDDYFGRYAFGWNQSRVSFGL